MACAHIQGYLIKIDVNSGTCFLLRVFMTGPQWIKQSEFFNWLQHKLHSLASSYNEVQLVKAVAAVGDRWRDRRPEPFPLSQGRRRPSDRGKRSGRDLTGENMSSAWPSGEAILNGSWPQGPDRTWWPWVRRFVAAYLARPWCRNGGTRSH